MLYCKPKVAVYCGWCSLSLGEQEHRTNVNGVPYHDRCAETHQKQKGKVIVVKFAQVFTREA